MIWTFLGAINGGVLLAGVLCGLLLAVAYCLGPAKQSTAYSPMTAGETVSLSVRQLRPFPCEVEGCKGRRSARHLVCPGCWRHVPEPLRSEFYRAFGKMQAGHPDAYRKWLAVRQKCLESLE